MAEIIKNKGPGTKTTAQRHCLLPTATHTMPYRSTISPRPGPGDYSADYNSVLPKRSTTFDGQQKQANACSDEAAAVASLTERKCILEGRCVTATFAATAAFAAAFATFTFTFTFTLHLHRHRHRHCHHHDDHHHDKPHNPGTGE